MATVLNELLTAGEFIATEANGSRSRETVTIAAAAGAMVDGTVLGKITASGKYVAYAAGAADGTEVAAGILIGNVADTAADQNAVAIVRDAEVVTTSLTGDDADGLADLLALGIIAR